MKNKLFEKLQELEIELFGEQNKPISTNILNYLIPVTTELLNRVPINMPEYTNHDIKHSYEILNIISKILPQNVNLNIVEIQILIYTVLLHDIGMVINNAEKEELLKSDEFIKLTREFDSSVSDEEILTELIRRTHVQRSCNYVDIFKSNFTEYKIEFEFKGIDLSDYIKNIILSHEKSVKFLEDEKKFPQKLLIVDKYVNVQYVAILLRLGDILDFDIFRTPPYLFHHIGIKNIISQGEWLKHQSITGRNFSTGCIVYHAKPKSIQIHRKVEEFIEWIEIERKESMELLNKNNSNEYYLELKEPVKYEIIEDGYIYTKLEINLDYEKVLNILMGTELYDNPDIFLRELLQNSYDACKYYKEVFDKKDDEFTSYNPKVFIKYDSDNKILEVIDNGIGIDVETFENYVIKIGKSFYKSKYFTREGMSFSPISNFGIGIISCFMISDTIEIESFKEECKPIHFIMNVKDKYIEQLSTKKNTNGTRIKLKLHDDFFDKIKSSSINEIIENNMTKFPIPIVLKDIKKNETYFFDKKNIDVPDDYKLISGIEIIDINEEEDLNGYIILHGYGHHYLKNIRLSQQNFVIGGISITPNFSSNTKYEIDISSRYKLKLKASRNQIHEDDELKKLKKLISTIVINYLIEKKYDYNKLSNFLNDGRGKILNFQNELDFIFNIKMFNILKKIIIPSNQYNHQYLSFNEIINSFSDSKTYKIASIKNVFIEQQNQKLILGYLIENNYDFVIIENFQNIHYFYQFIKPFSKYNKVLSPDNIKGFTYNSIFVDKKVDLKIENFNDNYSWTSIDDEMENNIFVIASNNHYNINFLSFNKKSLLGNLLDKNDKRMYVKGFKNSINNNFAKVAFNSHKVVLNNFEWDDKENHFFGVLQNGFPYSIKFVDCLNNLFLDSLNEVLKINVLEKLVLDGIINKNEIEQYLLKKDNFPKWYFINE